MTDNEMRALPAKIAQSARQLHPVVLAATDMQWQRPPVLRMDKAGGGAPSAISNPTADITLNTERLRLRAAVLAAGRELAVVLERAENARVTLERAVTEFEGQG